MTIHNISIQYYKTPVGELIIGSQQDVLVLCDWRYRKMRTLIDDRIKKALKADFIEEESSIGLLTVKQLNEYFKSERQAFDIAIKLCGTDFQCRVWNALQAIPYGTTESYLNISKRLGNEKAVRAVASANGANALSIIVPCHRIIGSNGALVGYAGGTNAKQQLLHLEGLKPMNEQLSLF